MGRGAWCARRAAGARQQSQHNATAHDGAVTSLLATLDGHHMLSAGTDARIRLWDAHTGCNTLVNFPPAPVRPLGPIQMAVSNSGPAGSVLYHPSGSTIQALRVSSGRPQAVLRGHYDVVKCCTFLPHLQARLLLLLLLLAELYSGGNDRQILVWAPVSKHVAEEGPPVAASKGMKGKVVSAPMHDEDAWSDDDMG
eukprot:jgi/Mesen1/565/ME000107S10802